MASLTAHKVTMPSPVLRPWLRLLLPLSELSLKEDQDVTFLCQRNLLANCWATLLSRQHDVGPCGSLRSLTRGFFNKYTLLRLPNALGVDLAKVVSWKFLTNRTD